MNAEAPAPTRRPPPRSRTRVAVVLLTAAAVATVPAVWFGWSALDDVGTEIDGSRLRLAELAATQADRVVAEAFFEIELMAQAIQLYGPDGGSETRAAALRTAHGQAASFHAGVLFIGPDATVVIEEPRGRATDAGLPAVLEDAAASNDRSVSRPWVDEASSHVVAALSVPVFGGDEERLGTMVGILDLAEPLVSDLVIPASRLGPTGHADLVDERGVVLASTNPAHVLTAGDHPDFYDRLAVTRAAAVERVAHDPDPVNLDRSDWHVMAYAPLQNAPWGVAMGASDTETYEPVVRLRRRLIVIGAASAVVLLVGAALALGQTPPSRS